MALTHEIIEYKQSLPMKLFYQRIGHISKHWHQSLEILLVLSGELLILMEDTMYQCREDDIIVINPNQIHETNSKDCVLISLQLRLSMFHLDWLAPGKVFFQCNSTLSNNKEAYRKMKEIIARLVQSNSAEVPHNELINYSYAYQLIHELALNFRLEEDQNRLHTQLNLNRLRSITRYIEANCSENISLKSVADHEYLSTSYLSHFIKKNFGVSFSDYVTRLRLERSLMDLMNDNLSIEEIARRNGFPSPRSFSTLFKKQYQMLPSQYRKENTSIPKAISAWDHAQTTNYLKLDKFDYFDKLSPYLTTEHTPSLVAKGTTNIRNLGIIDSSTNIATLQHTFRTFCSVGRAKELLYEDIRDMLRIQQREMPFKYIKFHGIFDDELKVYQEDTNGNPTLYFYYIDKILDFLLSVNLKPLLQLSFMPKAMAMHPERTIFYHPFIISEPKDPARWSFLVSEFVKHLINRYGNSEVRSWMFTFWNETMNQFPFDFDTLQTSLDLYRISYESVKSQDVKLIFTSTSYIATSYPDENYDRFLAYANDHNCTPDAFLFNFYPLIPDVSDKKPALTLKEFNYLTNENSFNLSDNRDLFHHYIQMLNSDLRAKYPLPIYITEWNLSPSHHEWLNDTCFSSCYIVRNILQNYDKMDSFCHWSLTDWLEEVKQPQETFHGGMGFFTRNGIKKPAYYGYYLLTKLEHILVSSEEGCFITRNKDENRYSILLYNYQHFTKLYAQGITFNTSFEERYNAFYNSKNIKYSLSLNNVPNGNYQLSETIVNRSYGSVFDQWIKMGAVELEKEEEIETLKNLSTPMIRKRYISVTDRLLEYQAELEPHEVRLLQIQL
jgi:xylan 1,4-beta-xylosidase